MRLFRSKSTATIRHSSTESTPPSPSSQETPSPPRGLFRRKSSANVRAGSIDSTSSISSQESSSSIPRRLFRRKSSATIRPSSTETTSSPHSTSEESSPAPSSPRPYTSRDSPPPIPTQFLQQSPPISPISLDDIEGDETSIPNANANRFSTTSTLFEREVPAPPPPQPAQQPTFEAYVSTARESDLQRLQRDAMMALAWVQAEERRRAAASRSWQHDPWRGGFGPSGPRQQGRVAPPVAAPVVSPAVIQSAREDAVRALSPTPEVQVQVQVQGRNGNGSGLRRGLLRAQSNFNLRWRARPARPAVVG